MSLADPRPLDFGVPGPRFAPDVVREPAGAVSRVRSARVRPFVLLLFVRHSGQPRPRPQYRAASGQRNQLYVQHSDNPPAKTPTGTADAPFASVGAALEEAEAETDIVLMPGTGPYPPIICVAPPPGMRWWGLKCRGLPRAARLCARVRDCAMILYRIGEGEMLIKQPLL